MNWKIILTALLCAPVFFLAQPASAVEDGVDFLVGTWTRDGDCADGDVIRRDGARFFSKSRGQNYSGTVSREGDIIKTNFATDDGNVRRYTYHIENDNRLRVVDLVICDRVHCELMHVQTYFYVMRCAE